MNLTYSLTDDINMSCYELVYARADGKLTATAAPGKLVNIVVA